MSDAVQLALIGMLQQWGLAIIEKGPAIVTAIGSVVITVGGWWLGRKVSTHGKSIVESVESVKKVAALSDEQTSLIAKGAERKGVEIGIKTEQMRASDLQKLREGYKPESTDVFMARTGGDR